MMPTRASFAELSKGQEKSHETIGFFFPSLARILGSNGSMIAIGHANDEVGVWPSAYANELDALAVQRVVGVRDGHFHWPAHGRRGAVVGVLADCRRQ